MDSAPSKSSTNNRLKWAALVILFLAMAACIIGLAVTLVQAQNAETGTPSPAPTSTTVNPTDPPVTVTSASGTYRFAAVAADSELCSQIGTDILASKGGSAVDSAIATLLCVGVVHSHSMGIGGGFFMTVFNKESGQTETLISREVAPLAATTDMFVNNSASSTLGGMAVGVPGEIAGYAEAWRRYGKLPWAVLFAPTIRLCEQGFPATSELTDALDFVLQRVRDGVREDPGLSSFLLKQDGSPIKKGDILRRPTLARTLRRIADEGADTFYNGTLADDIAADVQDIGGIITKQDLMNYRPVWRQPVSVHLDNGNLTLYGPPPPSSAAVLQYILNILDGYDISPENMETTTDSRVLRYHRIVEAMKFGFAKRSLLGDEDFWNVTTLMELLQSSTYADETRLKIRGDGVLTLDDYEPGFDAVSDSGTSHVSVLSPNGSAVAVTSTINLFFGSKRMGNRTGIIFNNEMDDFSTPGTVNFFGLPASPSNFIEPGKRPMSSMSPTLVTDGNGIVMAVAGAAGGTRIISATMEALLNSLWLGMNASEALDSPRFHHQLLPNVILHDQTMPLEIIDGLKNKGHNLTTGRFFGVQMILNKCGSSEDQDTAHPVNTSFYSNNCITAACDKINGGAPDGY